MRCGSAWRGLAVKLAAQVLTMMATGVIMLFLAIFWPHEWLQRVGMLLVFGGAAWYFLARHRTLRGKE